jgi:subtilisin family serine protease
MHLLVILALAGSSLAGVIDQSFLSTMSSGEKRDAILEFSPVLDNVLQHSSLKGLSGDERNTKIVGLMQEKTRLMQLPVMNALTSMGLASKATPFWAGNKIALSGVDSNVLTAVSTIPGPFKVREAQTVTAFPIADSRPVEMSKRQSTEYQWGVAKINAPAVYATTTGEGAVVGVIDTGINAQHEALVGSYKNDEYSWKDMVQNKPDPYDDHGHGSHCAGTIAGQTNGIGVAPGAKVIACKALDSRGGGTEKALTGCGQFMACPDNSTGECRGFPNIVSNSWGGGNDNQFYNSIVSMWRAMNIVPIFAIGNAGSLCGSANSPGDQNSLMSVGATDQNDDVTSFSSRGPGGPNLLGIGRILYGSKVKPEVSAPGLNIVSASHNNNTGYVTMSGTSMATPHVAGAAALYISINKDADPQEVIEAFEKTAVPRRGNKRCSVRFGTDGIPNNDYGYGRIDVQKAMGL